MKQRHVTIKVGDIKSVTLQSKEYPDNYVLFLENGNKYVLPKEMNIAKGAKMDTFDYIREQTKLLHKEIELVEE